MDTLVTTRQGDARGSLVDGVRAFKGIPYAAPPIGANRFQPPRPAATWKGVRNALTYGPKTRQPSYPPGIALLLNELTAGGDDALTLNVWAPAFGSAPHPVMVWIPGGMFEFHGTGASPWYDGSRFARDGIVCVTINYRVGADGFLFCGDDNANIGLLDQIAALTWVRDNIDMFGGDPSRVTVFGESAGAISIAALLAMPRAAGLFRRAIMQSGAAHPVMSAATARRVSGNLARKLGVPATRDAIAAVPVDRVLDAQIEMDAELAADPDPQRWGHEVADSRMLWQPVIDGVILPAHPLDRIAAGAAAFVDVLIGTNTDEHRLFLAPSGAIERTTDEGLASVISALGLPVDTTRAVYRSRYPDGSPGDLLAAIQTDWFWRHPAISLAEAHAERALPRPTCTSSRGARRSSTACSARVTLSRFPSSSTRWGSGPMDYGGPILHNSSRMRCTRRGWDSRPTDAATGRSTTLSGERRCASTSDPRLWKILVRRKGRRGKACSCLPTDAEGGGPRGPPYERGPALVRSRRGTLRALVHDSLVVGFADVDDLLVEVRHFIDCARTATHPLTRVRVVLVGGSIVVDGREHQVPSPLGKQGRSPGHRCN